jgi:class 3 adenylate cyclase
VTCGGAGHLGRPRAAPSGETAAHEAGLAAISSNQGRVVKRLGDGHMAVFGDLRAGVDSARAIQDGLTGVVVGGHEPRLRAGLHLGRPRKLGGD